MNCSHNSIAGMVLRVPGSYYGTNIWRVTYRIESNGKIEERQKLVAGVYTCSGFDGELRAAVALASAYGKRPVKIVKCEFVETAILTGAPAEALDKNFARRTLADKEKP